MQKYVDLLYVPEDKYFYLLRHLLAHGQDDIVDILKNCESREAHRG